MKAQGRRDDEDDAAGDILLLSGGRHDIAVLYGRQQTGKLSEAEQQSASAEDKSIAEMAVEEIDDDIVEGSDREGNSCANKERGAI